MYATAGDVLEHLAQVGKRQDTLAKLRPLRVTRVFLEGRRGDEYVPPGMLAEVRDFIAVQGIRSSGGIATVPGSSFGTRQNEGLGWLNWESDKTRTDLAGFFRENAQVFDELIVDDFFCTGDTSSASEQSRASRTWSGYRCDLLVSLIERLMLRPARGQRPGVPLIIKFPRWYDRFHLFVAGEKSRERLDCAGPSRRFAGRKTSARALDPHGGSSRNADSGPSGNRTPNAGASHRPPSQEAHP